MQPLLELLDQIGKVSELEDTGKRALLKKHKAYPFSPLEKKIKIEHGDSKCPVCDGRMPRGFYFFTADFSEFYVQADADFWKYVGKIMQEGSIKCQSSPSHSFKIKKDLSFEQVIT